MKSQTKKTRPRDLYYNAGFLSTEEKKQLVAWTESIYPLWEMRFSDNNPPPEGDQQRPLLRPVYWPGNWQFACLDYYHPPEGTMNRAVESEPFAPILARLAGRLEEVARKMFQGASMPEGWRLNSCLVNFYGDAFIDGKKTDRARVGEHKDFEPGPVGSISIGERSLFQFVTGKPDASGNAKVIHQEWLDHGSALVFGGKKWKSECFHRIQRVENKGLWKFKVNIDNFETRRINLTFRYVPKEHWVKFKDLPAPLAADIRPYMETLALHSPFFKRALEEK